MVTKAKILAQGGVRKHIMFICQLWMDDKGKVSHSKFWNNIACAVATVIVARMGTTITLEFFQWYLGLVGFQTLASKFMSMKLGGGTLPKEDEPTKPK